MRPLIIGNIISNLYFIISILSESLLCNSENHDFVLYRKEYVQEFYIDYKFRNTPTPFALPPLGIYFIYNLNYYILNIYFLD